MGSASLCYTVLMRWLGSSTIEHILNLLQTHICKHAHVRTHTRPGITLFFGLVGVLPGANVLLYGFVLSSTERYLVGMERRMS